MHFGKQPVMSSQSAQPRWKQIVLSLIHIFIDLDQLAADGLLKPEDYAKENWGTNPNYCDYALLYQKRYKVPRKAYAAFLQQRPVPGYDTPYSDDWYRFTRCV